MRFRLLLTWGLIGILAALAAAVHGQTDENLILYNDTSYTLSESAIREEAGPLLEANVRIGIYLVEAGGGASDFLQRLQADNLGNGVYADDDVLAVYISLQPRYVEIRWGENYDNQITQAAVDDFRTNTLNTFLRERQFSQGFAAAFDALDDMIRGSYNIPTTPNTPATYEYQTPPNPISELFEFFGESPLALVCLFGGFFWFGLPALQSMATGRGYWEHFTENMQKSGSDDDDSDGWGGNSSGGSHSRRSSSSRSSTRSSGSSSRGGSSGGSW